MHKAVDEPGRAETILNQHLGVEPGFNGTKNSYDIAALFLIHTLTLQLFTISCWSVDLVCAFTLAFETLALNIVCGLLSNSLAEVLLKFELKKLFKLLDHMHQLMRLIRWLVCLIGFILLGLFRPSQFKLLLLGLFSVSAASDFETSFLPPNWYVYGSTAVGLAVGFMAGLRDAVVAQALCFAMMVFAVLFANAADSGDIKLLIQYGATAGSLGAVGIGIAVVFVVRIGMLIAKWIHYRMQQRDLSSEFSAASRARVPHDPIA